MIIFDNPDNISLNGTYEVVTYRKKTYAVFHTSLLPTVVNNYLKTYPSLSLVTNPELISKILKYATGNTSTVSKESE